MEKTTELLEERHMVPLMAHEAGREAARDPTQSQ